MRIFAVSSSVVASNLRLLKTKIMTNRNKMSGNFLWFRFSIITFDGCEFIFESQIERLQAVFHFAHRERWYAYTFLRNYTQRKQISTNFFVVFLCVECLTN